MQRNNRIEWLDTSKGIFIALVVLGHIMPLGNIVYGNVLSSTSAAFRMWIYACHIPGFFIISGILKNRLDYINRTHDLFTVIKKQKRVMMYYVIFSLIFFIRYLVQAYVGQNSWDDVLLFAYNTVTLVGMGVLWFIPAFAISEIIVFVFLIGSLRIRLAYASILIIAMIATFFHQQHGIGDNWSLLVKLEGLFYRSIIGSSFVIIGYFMDKKKLFDTWPLLLGFVSVFSYLNGNVDLNNLFFHNIIYYYLFAITGAMLVFMAAKGLLRICKPIANLCSYWGGQLYSSCVHMQYYLSYKQARRLQVSWYII